ncbi:MAG TPA: glycosyltransferase [Syntrophorhabdales bacterium]|nr:glycosyltransferase [Syntrophorhabdales bacterium]
MTEPLVSILMLTYNHAPFIAQAIEGVLQQQTNFPFQLIIGEDCSTDGTREIVFEYQEEHSDIIRVVTSDRNVGVTENLCRTGKACRGKYVAFCEGDDYWHHPHKLQKQMDYMESHPGCGMVYSSYDVYHVRSQKRIKDFIKYRKWKMPKNPSIHNFLEGSDAIGYGILTCTVMVRRDYSQQVVERDPYLHQTRKFLMGDVQLWAEIATIAQLHYIPESLATHNILDESATRSKDARKRWRFGISNAELMLYLCDKYNAPSSIKKKREADWCYCALRLAFHSRSAELADEVRRKKGTLTGREWLLYFGARYAAFYYVCRVAVLGRNLFRKEPDAWL